MDLPHLCCVFLACAIQGSKSPLSIEASCMRNAEIAEMRFRVAGGVNRAEAGRCPCPAARGGGCAGR